MQLFEFVKNLFTKEEKIDSSVNFKEGFMVNRFLSMVPEGFIAASESNKYLSRLPEWAVNSFLFHSIEKRKNAPWINFIKAESTRGKLLDKISKHFNCSAKTALQIKAIFEKQGVDPYSIYGMKKGK